MSVDNTHRLRIGIRAFKSFITGVGWYCQQYGIQYEISLT